MGIDTLSVRRWMQTMSASAKILDGPPHPKAKAGSNSLAAPPAEGPAGGAPVVRKLARRPRANAGPSASSRARYAERHGG
jgi:hypothetical protein